MAENKLKIVGLGGSLAQNSISLGTLKIALHGASEAGAQTEVFDLYSLNLPMYSPESMRVPEAAQRFIDAVADCQGMIWCSPLYHGSVSGAFKNAIDWLEHLSQNTPPYLTDKIIGLVATAGGVQGLQAINTMQFIVRAMHGWAVPIVLPIAMAWQVFDQEGKILDDNLQAQLEGLGREVYRAAKQFQTDNRCDYAVTELNTPRTDVIDVVTVGSELSFPASDPPAWGNAPQR
jgi:FMN reductase